LNDELLGPPLLTHVPHPLSTTFKRVDGVTLDEQEKERFQDAFTTGVAAAVQIKAEDVILNYVKTADVLSNDGTGIDVDYTVIATQYDVKGLVELIESRTTTDNEVTSLHNQGYPAASCSAEVITEVIEPPTSPPSTTPTPKPSTKPTTKPTDVPSRNPTERPSGDPTERPTEVPTKKPFTYEPTERPTEVPTKKPFTYEPTEKPTRSPSEEPTEFPTHVPYTVKPTGAPFTHKPTVQPTEQPTGVRRTRSPTRAPITHVPTTAQPTDSPTRLVRTRRPTDKPVAVPTEQPTDSPTRMVRTRRPTESPTPGQPTDSPTRMVRTRRPTESPTPAQPTDTPTRIVRTRRPTELPTEQPTESRKTRKPTFQPTAFSSMLCDNPGTVYVVGLQRIDNVGIDDAAQPEFSGAIRTAVAESLDVEYEHTDIQSIAAAKYSNSRGGAVDVIYSIYSAYDCPVDVDDILKGRTTTDNIVSELNDAGFDATASSESILIDYSPSATPTAAPTSAIIQVTVTQVVTGVNCESISKEAAFEKSFDAGIENGLAQPTCGVGINQIDPAIGGVGCDVTYVVTCDAGTNPDVIKHDALLQSTADACTASIETNGYPTGVCGEVMVFIDQSPTMSPTEPYQVAFEAAEALEGQCVNPETVGSPEFISAFEGAVATCIKVDPSDVTVRGAKISDLDPPSVIIDYVVAVPDSSKDAQEYVDRLNNVCIPTGAITELLYKAGYLDCEANKPAAISTLAPTTLPTESPTTLEDRFTDEEWAGIAVGVVFGAAALALYSYYMYVNICLKTPITGA